MSEATEALEILVGLFNLLPDDKTFLIRPAKEDVTEEPFEKLLKQSKQAKLERGVTQKQVDALLTELGVLKTRTQNGERVFALDIPELDKLVNAHPSGFKASIQNETRTGKVTGKKCRVKTVKVRVRADENYLFDYSRSILRKREADALPTAVRASSRLKRTRTNNESSVITPPPSATSAATSAAADTSAVNANDADANADNTTATATAQRYSATLPPTITNISKCTPSIVFGSHPSAIEIQELDFTSKPRMYKGKEIQLASTTPRNIDDNTRHLVISTAIMMGYRTDSSNGERDRITEAAMRHVYYLKGYDPPQTKAPERTRLMIDGTINFLQGNSSDTGKIGRKRIRKKKMSKTEKIMKHSPKALRKAFRYACYAIGDNSTFTDIAKVMTRYIMSKKLVANDDQAKRLKIQFPINLKKHDVRDWFLKHNGKSRKMKIKPKLTADHIKGRLRWAIDMKKRIKEATYEKPVYYCFIDEKWFYFYSKRKKVKDLPKEDWEDDDEECVEFEQVQRTTRSRRFVPKVMAMAFVAPPLLGLMRLAALAAKKLGQVLGKVNGETVHDEWCNGLVYLKRVSEKRTTKKNSKHTKFVNDAKTNNLLKAGDWRNLFDKKMSVGDLFHNIKQRYALTEEKADMLCLTYKKFNRKKYGTVDLTIENEDELVVRRVKERGGRQKQLTIDDFDLSIFVPKGTEVEVDCTCDSKFMLKVMREVGMSIRNYFFWVPIEIKILLVIDNAGGHGTKDTIETYREFLKEHYNIVLHHQTPRSPGHNQLDLGIWCSIQSWVEKLTTGFRHDADVLWTQVEAAWRSMSYETLEKVHQRWLKVLDLTILDKGNNRLEEKYRGKLTYDPQKVEEIEEEELQKRLQAELDDQGNQAQSAEDIQAENDAANEEAIERLDDDADENTNEEEEEELEETNLLLSDLPCDDDDEEEEDSDYEDDCCSDSDSSVDGEDGEDGDY
ncbi:predicted protein [Chaetoceros tenuissimus]|uniref:Uncharacterized protein n=1 Tax=Chaetoceros tenuissimus TaxID=426638 RepID=A0AAD3H9I2_9STRA|nr:predicted protein [Chaetoceros tenuissimus]